MADMEEKVQYQSDERLRDVHEVLENCQTRVSWLIAVTLIIGHVVLKLHFSYRSRRWNIYLNNSSLLKELTIQMHVL